MRTYLFYLLISFVFANCTKPINNSEKVKHQSIVKEEFIYEISNAPTSQCHASTIAVSGNNVVAAWFGGTHEKSRCRNLGFNKWKWEMVNSYWSCKWNSKDGSRYPSWNPVLFQPQNGPLFLYYKVGPSPREWWGLYVTSNDNGRTWSEPIRLPDGIYGPIKNKPIQLSNGEIISPTSTEHDGWKIQIEKVKIWGELGFLRAI